MGQKKYHPPATQRQQEGIKYLSGQATRHKEYCTKTTKIQAITPPGTALEAFLRRYKRDLLANLQALEVKRIIEHVDALLALRDGGAND